MASDKDRAAIEREIREAVRAAKEDARKEQKRSERKEKNRSRSSGQKEPLILKVDKWLDKWRW